MLSMYDVSLPPLIRALNNLSHILGIGETHAIAKSIAPEVLLNARLFPDMFHLTRQVQIATDMSKGAAARLAGIEIPSYADDESSFSDLQARIGKTIAFMQTITRAQLDGAETKSIELTVRKHQVEFTGLTYLTGWVLPNVYFHITTTYDILRHNGVELGKPDFLGNVKKL